MANSIRIHEETKPKKSSKAPSQSDVVCSICGKKQGQYTCPKCDLLYCSLDCYKSEKHQGCSESFYEENVKEELALDPGVDTEEKKRMLEVLDKYGEGATDEWKYQLPEDAKKKRKELEEQLANQEGEDEDEDISPEDLQELEKVVDQSSVEQLWGMLTEEEKAEFKKMLSSEELKIMTNM